MEKYDPLEEIEFRIAQLKAISPHDAKEGFMLEDIVNTLEKNKKLLSENPVTEYSGKIKRDHDVSQIKMAWQRRPAGSNDRIYVIKLDIDYFGDINKKHGEDKGDDVLKVSTEVLDEAITDILKETVRAADYIVGRGYHLHGEEKEVILFAPDEESARKAAERYRAKIEEESEKRFGFKVTESIGISQWGVDAEPYGAAAKRADRNMQIAKAVYGRNYIVGPDNVPDVSQKELEQMVAKDNIRKNARTLGLEMAEDGEGYRLYPKQEK